MRIAQVSAAQTAGGAERVAVDLHECYREAGHDAVLLTPNPDPTQPLEGVIPVDTDAGRPGWQRALSKVDHRLARPRASWRRRRGYDDYDYPWTAKLLDLLPWEPDVLHLHNLHGGWFDLRQLAPLSQRVPTVLTLHDASLLTGGPHVFCVQEQWGQGALRWNRERRAKAFAECRLNVVAPSRWMLGHASSSRLADAVVRSEVIPNGIDLSRFYFFRKSATESEDLRRAEYMDDSVYLLGVGLMGRGRPSHAAPEALIGDAAQLADDEEDLWALRVKLVGRRRRFGLLKRLTSSVEWVGQVNNRDELRRQYSSARLLTHYVREDNFPSVILEAMACGRPVLAPRVGGIPEQFTDGVHGRMYDVDDAEGRRRTLKKMLTDVETWARMGMAAEEHACRHFDRRRMAADYLGFYASIT